MNRKIAVAIFLWMIATVSVLGFNGDDRSAPGWLDQAAKLNVPTYQKDVPAVVLLQENSVSVGPDGTLTVTERHAVRLLTRDGRGYALASAPYLQSSGKVKDIHAWLIRPNGQVKAYGKDAILDRVSDPDDIYDEYRVKTIDPGDDADVGTVFGYETVREEHPLFTQDTWGFQRRLPVISSRYTLSLPAGWQANSITFNHDDIKPVVDGNTYSWQLQNLDPIPPEPDGLSIVNLAPHIAVNYYPQSANSQVYEKWSDVSKWYTDLSQASLTMDDTIAGKARDLTAGATTELDRIKAIAAYVQSIRYISLQLDVAHGGGHRPRPANVVMQRGYGDCKDKANLMRAMLKAVKIESHLVLIYSGDPTYVKAEWASPEQFNHCIIAISVGAETKAPTVFQSEKLGRIMAFDPTDPYTQVGDLPDHEQGSYALIAAGADGDLAKMPVLPGESNRLARQAEITLMPDGAISGKIVQLAYGQEAAYQRARSHLLSATEYRSSLEQWLTSRVKGAALTSSAPMDQTAKSEFELKLEFSAPTYAQLMQGRLMMFKPAMIGRLDQFRPVEGKRLTPMLIDSSNYDETIRIKLPAGFVVDEMPDADKIEMPFGRYWSKYELQGDTLIFTRKLELNRNVLPASAYNDVDKFFGVVRNGEVTPVVLVKK